MVDEEVTILALLQDKVSTPLRNIRKAFEGLFRLVRTAGRALASPFRGLTSILRGVRNQIFSIQGLLAGGLFAGIVRETVGLEAGIANVATLVDTTEVSIERLTDGIKGLSIESGQGFDTLNKALFDTISAGVDAGDAIEFLGTASKLARAGATDVSSATSGLVSILNAYGLEASAAAEVSDSLFQAQKGGITTIEALSRSIGKVAPIARAAGISIDETNAAVSALTASGLSTEEAVTSLRSVLSSLIKPTAEAVQKAQELGIEYNTVRLRTEGLLPFIQEVAEKTGLVDSELAQLFPNVKALTGVLNLGADGASRFSNILGSFATKAGATNEALEKTSQTLGALLSQLRQRFLVLLTEIGAALRPIIVDITEGLNNAIDGVLRRRNELQAYIQGVVNAIVEAVRFVKTLFNEGDTITFFANLVTGILSTVTQIFIASVPLLIQTVATLGRTIATSFVRAFIGKTEEELVTAITDGGFIFRQLIGTVIPDEEFERLDKLGERLKATDKAIEQTISQIQKQFNVERTGGFLDLVEVDTGDLVQFRLNTVEGIRELFRAVEDETSDLAEGARRVINERIELSSSDVLFAELERLAKTREILVGEVFGNDTLGNQVKESVDALGQEAGAFIEESRSILSQGIDGLTSGLSDSSKQQFDALANSLGAGFEQLLAEAREKDKLFQEELDRQKAERDAKERSEAEGTEGVGTSATAKQAISDADLANLQAQAILTELQARIPILDEELGRLLFRREQAAALTRDGFITTQEGIDRDDQAFNKFNDLLTGAEQQIQQFLDLVPEDSTLLPTLEKIQLAIADIREEAETPPGGGAAGSGGEQGGTFFTGLEAALRNANDQFATGRTLGIQYGNALVDSFGQVIDLFVEGESSFRAFAASFIKEIAKMTLRAALFRAVAGFFGTGSGTAPNAVGTGTTGAGLRLGGPVIRRNLGGYVPGPSGVRTDTVNARLTPGEYVWDKDTVGYYGMRTIAAMHKRQLDPRVMAKLTAGANVSPGLVQRSFNRGGSVSGGAASGGSGNQPMIAAIPMSESVAEQFFAQGIGALRRIINDNQSDIRADLGIGETGVT